MNLIYLIAPAIVIVTGVIMLAVPTSEVFAFKTRTASKCLETQVFCNKLSARIMIAAGAVSAVAVLLTGRVTTTFFGVLSAGEFIDLLLAGIILVSIPAVNFCCKKRFPELF